LISFLMGLQVNCMVQTIHIIIGIYNHLRVTLLQQKTEFIRFRIHP
jgi:hypothetical protein